VITAVDTNILLDILIPGAPHGDESERLLTESLGDGSVIISEIVYTELSAHFPVREPIDTFLNEIGINMHPSGNDALFLAGKTWRDYVRRRVSTAVCPSCGIIQEFRCTECGSVIHPRQHVVADFLIGAHAVIHAERLLTRDRGYYRTYFKDLHLVDNTDISE
jgi:predicted nucleic acid-binding protein